jgi:S1-C subfamily serine protease
LSAPTTLRAWLVILVAFVLYSAVAICWVTPTSPAAKATTPATFATVKVNTYDKDGKGSGHGTGVILRDGAVLTASHVVTGAASVAFVVEGQPAVKARVLWEDKAHDVALLLPETIYSGIGRSLVCEAPPSIGTEVEVVGSPLLFDFVHTHGRIASKPQQIEDAWKSAVLADLSVAPGNSGGPAFDKDGNVVGMVVGMVMIPAGFSSSSAGLAIIVPSNVICSVIAYHKATS